MEALKASSFPSFHISTRNPRNICEKPSLRIPPSRRIATILPTHKSNFKIFTAISPTAPSSAEESPPLDQETEADKKEEKFDWYENWYPVEAVCDLDKRRPHGKKIIGIDVVVWWDRNEDAWKVFDDSCPHRLAPLSEGRIDQWGRLQCVYHGWCFGGAGDCKFIPQAPRDGPPVHTSNRACVAVYPSCVQNGILWFWPNADPQYKDIHLKKKPHYIPELDDPSFTNTMITRDIAYGYEVLIENLMDPSHVPYAHYGIMRIPKVPESVKADREGGRPIELSVQKIDVNGYTAKQIAGGNYFIAPCLYYGYFTPGGRQNMTPPDGAKDAILPPDPSQKKVMLIFYCIPVSPGHSRLIFVSPRNFAVWIDRILPRWIFHIGQNLILDSDLYLLHVEEQKLKEVGPLNWHKACFVPTKADAHVVAFRRWLNKYGGTQVDWRNKYTKTLNDDDEDDAETPGCWYKFRFFGSCLSTRAKVDSSVSGSGSSSQYAESKSTNDTSRDQPVVPVVSSSTTSNAESVPSTPKIEEELKISSQLRKFSYNELKLATRNFRPDSLLGEGGFGCVFKGWVNENGNTPVKPGTGLTVAVKTLNHDGLQGHREWLAEINYLGELVHPHLVKLIGYCIEDDQRLLVYEFMPRGSLENHLFKRSLPLPWSIRMKIAVNAAKGLAYLHEEAEKPVIYRDFKTSNILLDVDYNAKLSDFGLAKDGPEGDKTHVSTRVMGTYGYAAPEYVMTGHLTAKSDVYSFGVVLLELLTGRRSMDKTRPQGEHNLVEWARPYLGEKRRFYRLIDPRLEGRFSIKGAQKSVQLAARCLNRDAKVRPAMSEVVEALEPLPTLKDMACSSSYFQAMNTARGGVSMNARTGSRLQQGLTRNGQPFRSPSMPNRYYGSPYHDVQPLQSPVANKP